MTRTASLHVSCRDNGSLLQVVSTISVSIIVVFSAVVVAMSFHPIENPKPLRYWRPKGMLLSFPMLAYAFMCHTTLFSVYRNLSK